MSLIMNNNMMAVKAARNLNHTYGKLSTIVRCMSSEFRNKSYADEAADDMDVLNDNTIMSQASVSMLAQADTMSQMALSLLGEPHVPV